VRDTPQTRPPTSSAFLAGQLIGGRYRLEHRIASGGMAEVWQAGDEVLGRHVAVKILHPHLAADQAFVARFRTEAIAAARLHHPSIVAIYDTCHDEGLEAIVMELVRGTTLRDQLDGRGMLTPREVAHLGAEVADALAAAHRAGLVHRDIKPANILLCADERVMVTDFGIAKIRDDTDHTQAGTMLGTVKYLAPEQVRSEPVDGRTDIYSLGVVLFESACARPPFSGDNPAATALARLHQRAPRPSQLRPTIPPGLETVIVRCLERDPADRYQQADDLRAALLEPGLLASADDDLTVIEDPPVGDDLTHAWRAPAVTTIAAAGAPVAAAAPGPAPVGEGGLGAGPPSHVGFMDPGPEPPPRHGVWLRPVLAIVLVVTALVVAFLLVDRTSLGHRLFGDDAATTTSAPATVPAAAALTPSSVNSFDPEGSGTPGENDSQLPLAIDGNPATGWSTESYSDRHFGNLKGGVGISLSLAQASRLGQLRVVSPTQDWSAQVYVSDADVAPTTLAGWGKPVAHHDGIAGNATFDLAGHTGRHVLLWITDLGSGDPRVHTQIDELTLRS
jgi:eukaryotic-like serine/threonine-protein kinase